MIAYDRDEAGDRAAEKLAAELATMGIEVLRVVFPRGMDANEYALKVQPAAQSLGLVLRQAQWLAGVRRDGALAASEPAQAKSEVVLESEAAPALENLSSLVAEPAAGEQALEVSEAEAEPIIEPASVAAPAVTEPAEAPAPRRLTASDVRRLADELGDVADNTPSSPASPPRSSSTPAASGDEVSFQFGDRRWRVRGLGWRRAPVLRRAR